MQGELDEIRVQDFSYQSLLGKDLEYDPWVDLLRRTLPNTYSRSPLVKILKHYKVHPTRESLIYAVALLLTQEQHLVIRARTIIRKVVGMQCTNPHSHRYGNWPKFWEEYILKLPRNDPNWADFIGTYLLQIVIHHRSLISEDLAKKIDRAIILAARSIQRRDVEPSYTNIAIRGTYVTLVAAERFRIHDLYEYGLERLRKIYQYTARQGCFTEYNSPNYCLSTLDSLGRLKLHVKSTDAQYWITYLYKTAWKEIVCRFHLPTLQWSGPHSRNYKAFTEPFVLDLLAQAKPGGLHLDQRVCNAEAAVQKWPPLVFPSELEPYFLSLDQPRTQVDEVVNESIKQRLTTYLAPDFTLGTVSFSDLWHQRRVLLAYWGDASSAYCLRLRCLCNGADFAAAHFVSVQEQGQVLGGITCATETDSFNPYVSYKHSKNRTVQDFRLRFEIAERQGRPIRFWCSHESKRLDFCIGGCRMQIVIHFSKLGESVGQWEIHQTGDRVCLDWLLSPGRLKRSVLNQSSPVGVGFSLQMAVNELPLPLVAVQESAGELAMNWESMSLKFPVRPSPVPVLYEGMVAQRHQDCSGAA